MKSVVAGQGTFGSVEYDVAGVLVGHGLTIEVGDSEVDTAGVVLGLPGVSTRAAARADHRVACRAVGKFFMLVFVVAVIAIGLAFAGGTLPEGNALRAATQGMRDIGGAIADGFGGGYRPMTGG